MMNSSLLGVHAKAHVETMEENSRNPKCCLWQLYHSPGLVYEVDPLCPSESLILWCEPVEDAG